MIKKILLLLLLLGAVMAVAFWFTREEWLQGFNQQRQAEKAEYAAKGRLFAETATQNQCMQQSIKDFGNCLSFDCTVNHGVFLKSCLGSAASSDNFCDGVPLYLDKPTQADKEWLKDQCWDKDINGEGCRFLVKQQIYFCSQISK